ncbi:MAG: serine/threonine protein kinase [Deltaproteobacteria bacterium]|nr:serine/threonine protein kinase [Deltaproteobacteria bacterium]
MTRPATVEAIPDSALPGIAQVLDASETLDEALAKLWRWGWLPSVWMDAPEVDALLDRVTWLRADRPPEARAGTFHLGHRVAGSSAQGPPEVGVYLAHRDGGAASAVVKLAIAADPLRALAFEREQEIASALAHPRVAKVLEIGETEAFRPYIALERARWGSVTRYLAERLSSELVVAWLSDVLEGLAHAHGEGICHGDIKPANLLVCENRRIELTDFGAVALGELMRNVRLVGTPNYLAPESQAEGARPTVASDLYAVGALAYEMVSGRPLFRRPSLCTLLIAHRTSPVPSLIPRLGIIVPKGLEPWVRTLVEKDPGRRFPSAEAARTALSRL